MPTFALSAKECGNHLLSRLSEDVFSALAPYLELVDLEFEQILEKRGQRISHVYFPCSAVLSVLVHMLEGTAAEVGTIGNEGFYGIDVLLGGEQAVARETMQCQISGKAFRLPSAGFVRTIKGRIALRAVVQRYMLVYISVMLQAGACDGLHTMEARFARWLLMSHDRVAKDSFHLTHASLARMLGAQRSSVVLVAGSFEQAGKICYSHGQMTILNRQALEDASCECYEIVQQQLERHVGFSRAK